MKDPVSEALNILAVGLRPYVAGRVTNVLRDVNLAQEISDWDAQALMVFMWDRWNDLFRNELSFVERSLISELRDFRNRWAHQNHFDEADVYRVLDDTERLLQAINSAEVSNVAHLRRESLNRLWLQELGDSDRHRLVRVLWPYLLCGCSAMAMDSAIIAFGSPPWSWILSTLVFLAMMRVAYLQSAREARRGPGPHECSHCGRIIYTVSCPYCTQNRFERNHDESQMTQPKLSDSWGNFRLSNRTVPPQSYETHGSTPVPAAENVKLR